jgi:DNA helicase-2/ATP-dependent DNA helicase PcrA
MGERTWSPQQQEIFSWFEKGKQNLVVRARAGSGKTTTIIEGISRAPERNVLMAAFNKKIAVELQSRLRHPTAQAKTLHSIGFGFVTRNWSHITLDDDRAERLVRHALGTTMAPDPIVRMIKRLASVGKNVMPLAEAKDVDALADLAYQFDLEPDEEYQREGWTVDSLAGFALMAMDLASDRDGTIDFDDMVYVPVRNGWVRPRFDLVVIDEAQDMNASQLLLATQVARKTGRIAVIGDDRQAIYGFRGADSNSIDRLKSNLKAQELGLTITYRCPKRVVDLAAKLVPDFRAAPEAPEGSVCTIDYELLPQRASVGDFVLSRKNAPLVKTCLKLLKIGTRARVEGREVGRGLLVILKKLHAFSIPDLVKQLELWKERTVSQLMASKKESAEKKVETVNDQVETLLALSEGLGSVKELEVRIEELFSDGVASGSYVVCSSVHRAKGLESDRVFVLEDTLYPGGRRNQIEEQNIHYVAVTRTRKELVWVTGIS